MTENEERLALIEEDLGRVDDPYVRGVLERERAELVDPNGEVRAVIDDWFTFDAAARWMDGTLVAPTDFPKGQGLSESRQDIDGTRSVPKSCK
jgi:hypothetical protein